MKIAQDLKKLQKEIQRLGTIVEKLAAAAAKSEKPKAAPKPIKKAPVKKAPVKKALPKKKAAQPTATDQVLKIINRSKKGVDTATLMQKTGFNQKKVRNILQRTYKQGKIARAAKGLYIGKK